MLLNVLALHNLVKSNDFKTVNILLKTVFWDNNDLGMRGETKSDDDLWFSWNNDGLHVLFINFKRYWQDVCSKENEVKF